jgi:hypothetical protein
MTPDEILEIDAKRNHPPGTVAGNLRAIMNDNTQKSGGVVRQGNTLIMFRVVAPQTVFFFCFTADTVSTLAKNLEMAFRMFKKLKFTQAVTTRQGPDVFSALQLINGKFSVQTQDVKGAPAAAVRL